MLLFQVGSQSYGIPLADVREIVPMTLLAGSACLPAAPYGAMIR